MTGKLGSLKVVMMLEGKGGPVGIGVCEVMGTEVRAACNGR